MTMSNLYKKLLECGQKKIKSAEYNGLQEFVEEIDVKDMMTLISEKLLSVEAPQILNYFLMGFSQKGSSLKKRLKLCQGVLKEIQFREIPSRNVVALTSCIALEVEKFSTNHLVSIAEQCIDFIRSSNSATQISWKELLPKVLAVVVDKKEIDFAGTEMSGIEFRHRMIQTICGIQWHPTIVAALAEMFIYMQLSSEEHLQIVNKLCGYLSELPPQEIPPLVHQLLQLCRNQHGITVFLALKKYFASHIYKANSDSEISSQCDSIENVDSKELTECESMVLYHIDESAKLSRGCVTELLKLAKSCTNCPEVILDPFLLAVLLSLSSTSAYEIQVIEVLKTAIWRSVIEEERKQESAWLSQMVNTESDVEQVLSRLISSKVCERDKVLKGLVTLNLSLLGTSAPKGKECIAELLWKCGRHALILLVKRQRQVAKTVLQNLTDRIITGQNVIQYTDCLNRICNSATLIVLENLPILNRLLDFLNQLPGHIAKRVITAALSVVRISNKLRDNLILVLRKALFSREIETRKIAVSGFLQLLKCLRIKGLAALSQSQNSYSGPSVFTQICLDIHTQAPTASNSSSNEAICLEVLGILRRCFMQQASVKICLYEGLYDALCRNPELCPSVLDILLNHFSQFYEPDPAILPPVCINKAIKLQGFEAVLQEPIGKLMFAIQQIVVKANEELGDNDPPRSLEKFTDILSSIVARLIKCDINNFDLDDSVNLNDIVPDSLQKQESIVQILGVYEAMMAYTVNSWCISSTQSQGQQLLSLYKGYNVLIDFVKNSKSGKKDVDGIGKKNTKKDKEKNQGKKPAAFKLPETSLDFNSIHRMLNLLLSEDITWASDEARADIRTRRVLYRYILQAATEVIQQSKLQMAQWKSSSVLKPCVELASLLYHQCLLKFNDISTFDLTVSVLSVECFAETMSLLFTHFKNNLPEIMAEMVGVAKGSGLGKQLKPLIKVFLKLLDETVQNEGEEDEASTKKLLLIIISCLNMLAQHLPTDCPEIVKTLDWLSNFAQNRRLPAVLHVKNLMMILFALISKSKPESSLYDCLALQLCNLFGTINDCEVEESPTTLELVNEATKTTVLPLLCSSLINCLDQVDWLIVRLRAENSVLVHPTAVASSPETRRATCRRREKELVQQLGHCINAAQSICCIAVCPGVCTESVFKLLSHMYNTLTALAKYFSSISNSDDHVYQDSRFGKVVKLAGTHLSDQISELILFVEDVSIEAKDKKGMQLVNLSKKQTVYIPRLVADLENFSKAITLLSNKCKDKTLSTNVKLTTMRDFRLHTKTLELIMNRNNQNESEDEDEGAPESQGPQTPQSNQSAKKRPNEENEFESARKRRKSAEY